MHPLRPDFAARLKQVDESGTTRIFSLIGHLRRQGRPVLNLAVGEPYFRTPKAVIAATQAALSARSTRYGPSAGEPELRARLAKTFTGFGRENIIITNGAKQGLFSLFQVLCNPGDEVILPRPCWVSFPEQIKLAGGIPVWADTRNHQLDPDAVRAALTPKTRLILVNTPNNPTGAVYSAEALSRIDRIAAESGAWLIADEAYHVYTFDERPHVSLFDVSSNPRRVITVRSFSKHFNMTGFRVGYVAADQAVIRALDRLQSHLSGNVCTFAQYGALAALDLPRRTFSRWRMKLEQLRDLAFGHARKLFACPKPQGAFYLFADIRHWLRAQESSADLAAALLDKTGVAVVPGEAFGSPGHIRISFAVEEKVIDHAFRKMTSFLIQRAGEEAAP